MDISVNGSRPAPSAPHGSPVHSKKKSKFKSLTVLSMALLLSIAVLVLAISALAAFSKDNSREARFIDESKLQAVFLNGGQVYFGDITSMNDDYLRMVNIYYLRVNQQVQPNKEDKQGDQDITLAKLGCELHRPQDEMIIKQDQVMFWENLKSDGPVANAVKQFLEQNPDGQKCETPTTNNSTTNAKPQN